jgi:hypothetical protein
MLPPKTHPTNMTSPVLLPRLAEWSTLLTNNAYVEGAICLALSLRLVQSRYPLRIYVVGTELQAEVEDAMRKEYLLLVRLCICNPHMGNFCYS